MYVGWHWCVGGYGVKVRNLLGRGNMMQSRTRTCTCHCDTCIWRFNTSKSVKEGWRWWRYSWYVWRNAVYHYFDFDRTSWEDRQIETSRSFDGMKKMSLTSIDNFPVIFSPSDRSIAGTLKCDHRHSLRFSLRVINEKGFLQRSDGFLKEFLDPSCLLRQEPSTSSRSCLPPLLSQPHPPVIYSRKFCFLVPARLAFPLLIERP